MNTGVDLIDQGNKSVTNKTIVNCWIKNFWNPILFRSFDFLDQEKDIHEELKIAFSNLFRSFVNANG